MESKKKIEGKGMKERKKEIEENWNEGWMDILFVGLLAGVGVLSRCILLEHPNSVVFDEQHFGTFTNWYISGEYFLDIHPPLGKLLLLITSYFIGYTGDYPFANQGEVYHHDKYYYLRLAPALFGALLIPLIYLIARNLKLSPSLSVLVSWMVLCENLIITESRYILCDSFLFFFDFLAIYCSLKANQQRTFTLRWAGWLLLTGIGMGLAVSVKFTALGIIGAIGVHQAMVLFSKINRNVMEQMVDSSVRFVMTLGPTLIIFFAFFVLHLQLLPFSGDGDLFMSKSFRARLIDKEARTYLGNPEKAKDMISGILELITTMHRVNVDLTATHPFQSYWYEWIFNSGRVLLYWQDLKEGFGMWIYGAINPVNGFLGTYIGVGGFCLLVFTYMLTFCFPGGNLLTAFRRAMERYAIPGNLIFFAFLGNILPYYLITRATWTYHYIPPLIFSYLLAGIVMQIIMDTLKEYDFDVYLNYRVLLSFLFLLIAIGFTYLAPWTYALPLSDIQNDRKFVFDSWRWKP